MALSESDTRAKLIDPALHSRGWTEDLIRREETAGAIEIVGEGVRKQPRGRIGYTLRVRVNPGTQPVALALIEALAGQFARGGTEELENPAVFQTPEVVRAGGLEALKALGRPAEVLQETKGRLFAA
jgi:hypothetical protein